jgi:3-deoxy-D-manno-octulosonic-acid transferase
VHPLVELLYEGAARAAQLGARFAPAGDGKTRRTFAARKGLVERWQRWAGGGRDPARPLLWVHAPSVGEGLQARPVLERIRRERPDIQIAYTFFSPSAEAFARALDVDRADYLPFDRTADARAMLDALRPGALVFSKLDVWPTLAREAAARAVRLGLISATLSDTSGRSSPLARAVLRDAYARLDAIGAIDEADGARLAALGAHAARVRVTGDTRYDQVWARAAAADRRGALLAPLASPRPTLVAGSTWPADEAPLFAAWRTLRAKIPAARLIVAPHEPTPDHVQPLERMAAQQGLRAARLGAEGAGAADVVIVDRVGVLGELYALATAAFVGGGFHAAGLHSVLEPAAYGAPAAFGPRFAMSRDARTLIDCGGGASVRDGAELGERLTTWLGTGGAGETAGAAAREMVRAGLGAAERSAVMVLELLRASP